MTHSGLYGHVGELKLARRDELIPEQPIAGRPAGRRGELQPLRRVESRSLNHVDIEIAVTVVVNERHTGAHDFRHEEVARSSGEVLEAQARFFGDIAE